MSKLPFSLRARTLLCVSLLAAAPLAHAGEIKMLMKDMKLGFPLSSLDQPAALAAGHRADQQPGYRLAARRQRGPARAAQVDRHRHPRAGARPLREPAAGAAPVAALDQRGRHAGLSCRKDRPSLALCSDVRHPAARVAEDQCGRTRDQLLRALLAADAGTEKPRAPRPHTGPSTCSMTDSEQLFVEGQQTEP